MAVPNSMADLATLAGSNSPAGSEAIGNSLDNYLRAHAAIIRSTNALASATIAAASTTDIGSADGESVQITGVATITSFGTGFTGCRRELRFSGASTLTNCANIVLPGGVNITTAAGDIIVMRCTGSGAWTLVSRAKPAITSSDVTAALGYTPVDPAAGTFTGDVRLAPAADGARLYLKNSAVADASAFLVGQGFGTVSDNIGYLINKANSSLVFGTNNVEVARLNATGMLGVGTNNPLSTIHMQRAGNNYIRLSDSGTLRGLIGISAGGGALVTGDAANDYVIRGETNILLAAGTTEIARVNSSGVTIGGGKKLSKVTVSNAAPGALTDGELYLRY